MMRIDMFCSPLPVTVVIETMIAIHCAVIITSKGIREIGRLVQSVGKISKPRYVSIMGQMSTILKNWKILPHMNPRAVLNAAA